MFQATPCSSSRGQLY